MALVVGLVFTALLTMLGLTAMGVSSLEERMSGNTRDHILAFNAAESGLRECEALLVPTAALPNFDGVTDDKKVASTPSTAGMYQAASAGNPSVATLVDWGSNTEVRINTVTPTGASAAPRCVVEEMPAIPGFGGGSLRSGVPQSQARMFRVTSRGIGRNTSTVVMLQSAYYRP